MMAKKPKYQNSGVYQRQKDTTERVVSEKLVAFSDPTYEGFVALWAWSTGAEDLVIDRVPASGERRVPVVYPIHPTYVRAANRGGR
jgi:hypothetical protein